MADISHTDLLYKWANDEDVRKNSFNSDKIDYETHKKWFKEKLNTNKSSIYIYYYNDIPIGQIRLDFDGDKAYISYSIDKVYRGQGHGDNILILIENELINTTLKYLYGKVKYNNIASQRKFEKLGFKKVCKEDYIEYIKDLVK